MKLFQLVVNYLLTIAIYCCGNNSIENIIRTFRKTLKNARDFLKIHVCKLLKIIYNFKHISRLSILNASRKYFENCERYEKIFQLKVV